MRAAVLVNDTTLTQDRGSFVGWSRLSFHKHEIIWGKGVAAACLLVDTKTRLAMADERALGDSGTVASAQFRAREVREIDPRRPKDCADTHDRLPAL